MASEDSSDARHDNITRPRCVNTKEASMRYRTIGSLLTLCLTIVGLAHAEEIVPSEQQTKLLRGTADVADCIRSVKGTGDADENNGHGPITYYNVPFDDGVFSFSWKVGVEQHVVLVFNGTRKGKASHVLKVYFNGAPTRNAKADALTLVTYDGSTRQKKKAKLARHKHHADAGQWHKTSVTFEDNKASIAINDKTFMVMSDRFREQIQQSGVMHMSGTLQTKDVKIQKR